MKTRKSPKSDSIRELARFWDSHDLTDFEGEMEEVKGRVFGRASRSSVRVELAPKELAAIRKIARTKGIGGEELIHKWVAEKLAST